MPLPDSPSTPFDALPLVLREARRLHHAACSQQLSTALPVLRRLLAAGVLKDTSLPQLHRTRHTVRRKHLLRLLAAEAGYATWEAWRPALGHTLPHELLHLRIHGKGWGTFNTWFASEDEARRAMHGREGRPVRVGRHTVWLTPESLQTLQGETQA